MRMTTRFHKWLHHNWQLYLLLLPVLAYILIFAYGPMWGLQLAFKNYNPMVGMAGSKWVGLKYFNQFFNTSIAWTSIRNTVVLSALNLLFSFPVPIVFALLLNHVRHGKRFVQTVTYAPNFISTVVLVSMITMFLAPTNGFLSQFLVTLGAKDALFLVRPEYFRTIYIASGIWQSMGFNAIVYIAALTGVSPELHESAMIDGASLFKRILHIDIPTIIPTTVIMLILSMGNILSIGYEKVYLLQNGMNLSVSEVVSTYVYKTGIQNAHQSFATAVGIFNSAVNLILLLVFNYIAKKVTSVSLF